MNKRLLRLRLKAQLYIEPLTPWPMEHRLRTVRKTKLVQQLDSFHADRYLTRCSTLVHTIDMAASYRESKSFR